MCVIMTDGHENASTEYNLETFRALIKAKEKDGWTFVYLGANQDSYKVGAQFGMSASNIANYSTKNTKHALRQMSVATMTYASNNAGGQSCSEFLSAKDKAEIEKGT